MLDRFKPFITADDESMGVADSITVIERGCGLHLGNDIAPPDAIIVKILIPFGEVFDCGEQTAGANRIIIRHAEFETVTCCRIGVGLIFDDNRVIVAEKGARHTERFEDVFFGKFAQRLSAYAFNDDGQQGVAGVAVEVLVAGVKIQTLLA